MELTLNLAWVCVALVGILAQIFILSRSAAPVRKPASNWRKIVAMGCALVILFFVISMTDDLHDQALLLEESKIKRITAEAKTSENPASDRLIFLDFSAYVVPMVFSPPAPVWNGIATHLSFLSIPAVAQESFGGRAPPFPFA